MTTRLERLVELMAKMEEMEKYMGDVMPSIKRELKEEIDRERRGELTRSIVGGAPCGSYIQFLDSDPPPPAEAVSDIQDAPPSISPDQVERADRGGNW